MVLVRSIVIFTASIWVVNIDGLTTFDRLREYKNFTTATGFCSFLSSRSCGQIYRDKFARMEELPLMNFTSNFNAYSKIDSKGFYRHNYFHHYNQDCLICDNVTSSRLLDNKNIVYSNGKPLLGLEPYELRQHHDFFLVYKNTTIPILNSTYIIRSDKINYIGLFIDNASISHMDENISTVIHSSNHYNDKYYANFDNNLLSYLPENLFHNVSRLFLSLSGNKFVNLNQSFCGPNYYQINLQNNNIESLYTCCNISVTNFNISGNTVQKFDPNSIENFPNIRSLDLSHNGMEELLSFPNDIQGTSNVQQSLMETLRSLFLHHNKLTLIPRRIFRRFINLENLYLQNNEISTLDPEALKDLTKLRQLDLSLNLIFHIPYGFFKDCTSLRDLSLAGNSIKSLSIHTFSGLNQLKILNISYNYLSHFLTTDLLQVHDLVGLDVSNNLIRKMDMAELVEMHGLKHISYANNLWNCADLAMIIKTAKKFLWNAEHGNFFNVPSIHGIPCSISKNVTWPEDITFEDFIAEISDEEGFETALAHLNEISYDVGNDRNLGILDNSALWYLIAVMAIIVIMDIVIKWSYKIYKSRWTICESYELLKSKSQHTVSSVIV